MTYNIKLKYETEFFVSALDEEFEAMLVSMTGQRSGMGQLCTATHTIELTSPEVPDDTQIETFGKRIFDAVKEGFSKSKGIEVRDTRFVGITSIRKETDGCIES